MASDLPRLSDSEIIVEALERYARDEARSRNLGPRNRKAEHGRRAARARELADDYREGSDAA